MGGNVDVIFVPYLFPYFGGVDSHLLVIGHVGAKIEFVDVNAKEASTKMVVVDGDIDVELCVWHQDRR